VDVKLCIDNATEYQVREMFLRFYPGEEDHCERFIDAIKALGTTVSTAQLQGLFVYNKNRPEGAIEMAPLLRGP
jgi:chaperone BCS1